MTLIKRNRPHLIANHFASAAFFLYGVLSVALLYLTVKHGDIFMYLAVIACMLECHGYYYITYFSDIDSRYLSTADISIYLHFPIAKLLITFINYNVIGRLLRASGRTRCVSFLLQFFCVLNIIIHPFIGFLMSFSDVVDSFDRWFVANILLSQLLMKNIPFAFTLCTVAFSKKFEMWEIPELRKTFYCLFSSTGLIFLGDVYLILQYYDYYGSYVTTNEAPFIILEMTTMLICFTLFTVFHYGKVTPIEFLRGYSRSSLLGITGEEYRRLPYP